LFLQLLGKLSCSFDQVEIRRPARHAFADTPIRFPPAG
jgi:hypothetical protein